MAKDSNQIDVYLEEGKSKTFAIALDWPGWCRGGRGEEAALNALYEYGPRYARVVKSTKLGFEPPAGATTLAVVYRQPGTGVTDFGAPELAIPRDLDPVSPADLERMQTILKACWAAVDSTLKTARGKALAKGPRGGGRDLDGVLEHIQGGGASYLTALGGKFKQGKLSPAEALAPMREAILEAMAASVRGEIPAVGPRGGHRWSVRYFTRRMAWHDLDHMWEIQDKVEG